MSGALSLLGSGRADGSLRESAPSRAGMLRGSVCERVGVGLGVGVESGVAGGSGCRRVPGGKVRALRAVEVEEEEEEDACGGTAGRRRPLRVELEGGEVEDDCGGWGEEGAAAGVETEAVEEVGRVMVVLVEVLGVLLVAAATEAPYSFDFLLFLRLWDLAGLGGGGVSGSGGRSPSSAWGDGGLGSEG